MQHFPFPACREKGTPQRTPKEIGIKGDMTLWHSNWTICSQQNLFYAGKIPLCQQATCSISLSCMQRKGHPTADPKSDWNQGVHDPVAF